VARWHAVRLRAAVAVLTGRFPEARSLAAQARVLADRVGDISMIGMHHAFHVLLGVLRGDPADVLPDSLDFIRKAPPIPLVRASLPLIHSLNGDLGRARAEFAALRDVAGRFPLGARWQGTVGQIALVAVRLGDADVARQCHRLLLPCAQWCAGDGGGAPFAEGSTEYPLGRLARTFGDLPLAAAHFERGIVVDDRVGARPFAALGRLGLAESLAHEDATRALGLVRAAAEELERLDMPGPLARATALSDRLAAQGPGRPDRPGGLTDRELEVARLVGQALTNQQVAERLFLSVRTVESHVRSVLAKLGLTTRTQLAVWVREHPEIGA
jgi:DNA-binding CsgD family transcriptional regulator